MAKQSEIDKAIAALDQEINILTLARARLLDQRAHKTQRKQRKTATEKRPTAEQP